MRGCGIAVAIICGHLAIAPCAFAQVPTETIRPGQAAPAPDQPILGRPPGERRGLEPVQMELEPGRIPSGNWGLNSLQGFLTYPASDDATLLRNYGQDVDQTWTPLLMDLGRRLAHTDPEGGAYLAWLGRQRLLYDAWVCAQEDSRSFAGHYLDQMRRFPEWRALMGDPEWSYAAVTRLVSDGKLFSSRVSAQYICKENYYMEAVLGQRAVVPLREWRRSDEDIRALEQDMLSRLVAMQTHLRDYREIFIVGAKRDGDIEPGATAFSRPLTPGHLARIMFRPESEDAIVLAELGEDYRFMPGPYIMERGRRLMRQDPDHGAEVYWLGVNRLLWEYQQCRNDNAGDKAATLYLSMFEGLEETDAVLNDSNLLRRLSTSLSGDERVFDTRVSSWWICEQALLIEAQESGNFTTFADWVQRPRVSLQEWRASEAQLRERRLAMEANLSGAAVQSRN